MLALVGKGDAGPLSIVVLPFANLTGDPQQAYLADGLTAAVTSDLSRIRDAFIVSTATAFAYKDRPVTVQQIGQELGVRFALQGGVQRSGEKIRINAQLADTTTNAQLWSESFDGNQGDLFGLQEMLTTRIGISLREKMVVVAARESETRKSDPTVADMMLRARALSFKRESKANYDERNALYRKVLLVEPNNVRAMVNLANSLSTEALNQIKDPAARETQLVEARDLALKAKELEPTYPSINTAITIYALTHGDFEGARRADEAELALNPKEPSAYSNLAGDHVDLGEPAKAVELLTQAIRLDPRKVDATILRNMTVAQFMLGDDEAAIEWARKALAANPGFIGQHAFMAMSYARKGRPHWVEGRSRIAANCGPDVHFDKVPSQQTSDIFTRLQHILGDTARPSMALGWSARVAKSRRSRARRGVA